MRKAIKYVNHLGQVANLFGDNVYANHKEALPYEYKLKYGYGKPQAKEFELLTVGLGKSTMDRLIDLLEVDTISNKYGRLYVGDWYIRCKYVSLSGSPREYQKGVKATLKFYAPVFVFTRDRLELLRPDKGELAETFLDFDFDFDFDLGGSVKTQAVVSNTQLLPADFILKFKATADSVRINIGNNAYIVSEAVKAGETFVIDTVEKQVYIESEAGKTDLFSKSSDIYNIFEQIPSGDQSVSWVGEFDISLLLMEHRSVAEWN